MNFQDLGLNPALLKTVERQGYTTATPIQELAIPHVLEGNDLLGCAQTGTGKTAAFALPMLHLLAEGANRQRPRHIRCLILAPTRELALQISESIEIFGRGVGLWGTVIFGGVSQHRQVQALRRSPDVLVATPGRLLDLLNQGHVNLEFVEILILDEADQMLDMGFIHDIRRIMKAMPEERQTLMFSATLPPAILDLAKNILSEPVTVSATPSGTPVALIEQQVCHVDQTNKVNLLIHLLQQPEMRKSVVFSRTKHGADKIVRKLDEAGIDSVAIHGNKSQNRRQEALEDFKDGAVRVMVATDVASRGLDIDKVSHVFNLDLPHEPEIYVHRIGRTGRAGLEGVAITFCAPEEHGMFRAIERLINKQIQVNAEHPFHIEPRGSGSRGQSGRPDFRQGRDNARGNGQQRSYRSDRDRSDRGDQPRTSGDRPHVEHRAPEHRSQEQRPVEPRRHDARPERAPLAESRPQRPARPAGERTEQRRHESRHGESRHPEHRGGHHVSSNAPARRRRRWDRDAEPTGGR